MKNTKDGLRKREKLVQVVNQKTDIPTQVILKSDFSKEQVPYFFYLAEKVEGYDPINRYKYLPREDKRKIVRESGKYLGELHKKVRFNSSGDFEYKDNGLEIDAQPWKSYMKKWADNYIQKLENTPFEDISRDFEDFIEKHIELAETDYNCCVHWDISPDNMIIKNGRINALIDWEKAVSGPPEWDIARARVHMIHRWFKSSEIKQELQEELFTGYNRERELQEKWKQRIIYFGNYSNFNGISKLH